MTTTEFMSLVMDSNLIGGRADQSSDLLVAGAIFLLLYILCHYFRRQHQEQHSDIELRTLLAQRYIPDRDLLREELYSRVEEDTVASAQASHGCTSLDIVIALRNAAADMETPIVPGTTYRLINMLDENWAVIGDLSVLTTSSLFLVLTRLISRVKVNTTDDSGNKVTLYADPSTATSQVLDLISRVPWLSRFRQ